MTFEEWWGLYLKAGGSNHFNVMADEESARAAWEAATNAALEWAARVCDEADRSIHPSELADRIRILKD